MSEYTTTKITLPTSWKNYLMNGNDTYMTPAEKLELREVLPNVNINNFYECDDNIPKGLFNGKFRELSDYTYILKIGE